MLVGYVLLVVAHFNSEASADTQHTVLDTFSLKSRSQERSEDSTMNDKRLGLSDEWGKAEVAAFFKTKSTEE